MHVPKTGGTSFEHALGMRGRRHGREDRRRLFGPVESAELKGRGLGSAFLQHLTLGEIRDLHRPGRFAQYWKVATVRNPWDRMVSIFHRPDGDMMDTARANGVELDGLSFPDFVEASTEVEHAHLRPQHEYVVDRRGRMGVDVLCRFSKLGEAFRSVCERLGIRRTLPVKYASPGRRDGYREYFTPRARALVARRYATDIEMFGYEF